MFSSKSAFNVSIVDADLNSIRSSAIMLIKQHFKNNQPQFLSKVVVIPKLAKNRNTWKLKEVYQGTFAYFKRDI